MDEEAGPVIGRGGGTGGPGCCKVIGPVIGRLEAGPGCCWAATTLDRWSTLVPAAPVPRPGPSSVVVPAASWSRGMPGVAAMAGAWAGPASGSDEVEVVLSSSDCGWAHAARSGGLVQGVWRVARGPCRVLGHVRVWTHRRSTMVLTPALMMHSAVVGWTHERSQHLSCWNIGSRLNTRRIGRGGEQVLGTGAWLGTDGSDPDGVLRGGDSDGSRLGRGCASCRGPVWTCSARAGRSSDCGRRGSAGTWQACARRARDAPRAPQRHAPLP